MLDEIYQDYVHAARTKGLTEDTILTVGFVYSVVNLFSRFKKKIQPFVLNLVSLKRTMKKIVFLQIGHEWYKNNSVILC